MNHESKIGFLILTRKARSNPILFGKMGSKHGMAL